MEIAARVMSVAGLVIFLFLGNVGAASALTATITTVSSGSLNNTSSYGAPVTFTAKVTPSAATGVVTFMDGPSPLGSWSLSGGTATFSTSDLSAGTHSDITAVYGGDENYSASTSVTMTQTVTIPTTSPLTFATHVDYGTGSLPTSVTLGDFNGDGKLDLAVANYSDATVSVLLGNGDGTFQPEVGYLTGSWPSSVVVGDFNGDGKLDLAVANFYDGTVSVLLGNGDGTFQPKVDYATGGSASSVTVGDFNGDGKLDLAVVNEISSTVSVLLGNGDGTFQKHVDYDTGNEPYSVAVGDFNGDGKLDLAVSNVKGGNVSVLLGNGDGTFQTHVDYGTGSEPESPTVGDFNGDGKLDIATANQGNNTVSVLLGNFFTVTVVSSSPNQSAYGQSVTFTATVSQSTATGTVTFMDGATTLGAATLSGGAATFSTSALAVGTHIITAVYGGDAKDTGSTSSGITQTVNKATTTTVVSSSPNPSTYSQSVTFTARVIPSIATGRVTFMDGGTTFDTGTLSNGSTTLSTSDLSVGAHTITAVYGGDTNNVASTSSGITQTVNVNGPSSTLISPANNAVLKGTNATITGTATDYSSSVVKNVKIGITPNGGTIKWYTATGATSWKFKWPLPKDGNYTIQSKATDKAGNVESPVYSVSVLVDKTKPTATIIPLASTTLSGTSVTISGTASDAGSGVNNVQIGITPRGSIKTTWYPASGATSWSYTWTLPTDGKYIIKAMATDNGGNTKTTAAVRVTVDNAPPTVSITVPVNNKVLEGTTATISGKASDSGSGVKNVQVGITPSGGTAIWYTASGTTVWSYKWPLPANGSYTIQARASDRADNSELSSQVNVTVSQ